MSGAVLPSLPSRFALVLPVLLVGACSLGPVHQVPQFPVPAQWSGPPPAVSQVATATTASLARWWTTLNDPVLDQWVADALAANPDLASAQAALRAARASRVQAQAGLAPQVSASATPQRTRSLGLDKTLYQTGFDASWELDVFGGQRRAVEAARAEESASEQDLYAAQVSLVSEVVLNYLNLRAAQQRLAIARDNLRSQDDTLQLTGWQAQAGTATALELAQARASRDSTAAQIPALETTRASAEYHLAVLAGRAPGSATAPLALPAEAWMNALPAMPAHIAQIIPAQALRQRPDVQAAERRLAAETARIGQKEAARYPSFSLSGSIGLAALGWSTLSAGGQIARSLGASISGPVWDAGSRAAQVDAQVAVRDQALASYHKTVLTALEDVENALVTLAQGDAQTRSLETGAEAARLAAELASQRYRAGITDFQTVLTTQRTRLSLEDSLAAARLTRLQGLVQLYKALGGGWSALPAPATGNHDS
jgi:NodT family efflux transporter outer membrane factor (OMF) lipoprotein